MELDKQFILNEIDRMELERDQQAIAYNGAIQYLRSLLPKANGAGSAPTAEQVKGESDNDN